MALDFFKCEKCGNVFIKAYATGQHGEGGNGLVKLEPNSTDAAKEKHVPVVQVDGAQVTVTVSSVEHPMAEDHYITMVALETKNGYQVANLAPGQAPKAVFAVAEGDEPVAAYEYCNKHGLWKAEI